MMSDNDTTNTQEEPATKDTIPGWIKLGAVLGIVSGVIRLGEVTSFILGGTWELLGAIPLMGWVVVLLLVVIAILCRVAWNNHKKATTKGKEAQ